MPFDYAKFDAQCATMSTDELLKVHKKYTKLSAGAMTSTAVSALSIPLTLGVSGLAIGMSMPAHHNAKKKKQIVEKYLKARGIEATQAAQYANAVASDSAQKQMWMDQQAWQNSQAGPSSGMKSPPPGDVKYNYNNPDGRSEKKSAKGPMPSEDAPAPPPPTYDEAQTAPKPGYASPPPDQQQQAYGQQQYQGWNQGYGAPQQPGWGQPQMGYGAPQAGWGQPQYCAPQTMYPNSAMYSGRPVGPDNRHVHFAQ